MAGELLRGSLHAQIPRRRSRYAIKISRAVARSSVRFTRKRSLRYQNSPHTSIAPWEKNHETPSQSTLPDPPLPLLLRKRANPKGTAPAPDGRQAGRRLTPSQGIPGTPFEWRDAEAPGSEDRCPKGHLRPLQGAVHRLRRHRARPHQSPRHGRSVEGRSPGQYPGGPLVV